MRCKEMKIKKEVMFRHYDSNYLFLRNLKHYKKDIRN